MDDVGWGAVASLVWDLLQQEALAGGAAASSFFGVVASGLVCGLAGGMGCGCCGRVLVSFFFRGISVVESQSTQCWASAIDDSWGEGRGQHLQEPLGTMAWASQCHTLMRCVFWCVEPAGFASGKGVSIQIESNL